MNQLLDFLAQNRFDYWRRMTWNNDFSTSLVSPRNRFYVHYQHTTRVDARNWTYTRSAIMLNYPDVYNYLVDLSKPSILSDRQLCHCCTLFDTPQLAIPRVLLTVKRNGFAALERQLRVNSVPGVAVDQNGQPLVDDFGNPWVGHVDFRPSTVDPIADEGFQLHKYFSNKNIHYKSVKNFFPYHWQMDSTEVLVDMFRNCEGKPLGYRMLGNIEDELDLNWRAVEEMFGLCRVAETEHNYQMFKNFTDNPAHQMPLTNKEAHVVMAIALHRVDVMHEIFDSRRCHNLLSK